MSAIESPVAAAVVVHVIEVDWLVEEGLRDINSESSRWSFPILIGPRLRF